MFTVCLKITKVYFAVGKKYMLFLPQKPVTLAIGSIARGLYFTCTKTENVANAYPHTKKILLRKEQKKRKRVKRVPGT